MTRFRSSAFFSSLRHTERAALRQLICPLRSRPRRSPRRPRYPPAPPGRGTSAAWTASTEVFCPGRLTGSWQFSSNFESVRQLPSALDRPQPPSRPGVMHPHVRGSFGQFFQPGSRFDPVHKPPHPRDSGPRSRTGAFQQSVHCSPPIGG